MQNVGKMYFRDCPQQHFGQIKNTCALCQSNQEPKALICFVFIGSPTETAINTSQIYISGVAP
jgi:hypothetical protein